MLYRPNRIVWIALLTLLMTLLVLGGCVQTDQIEPTSTPLSPLPDAKAYVSDGDLNTAKQIWEETLDRDPEDAGAHYYLGLALLLSDHDKSLSHLEQAEALNPDYAASISRVRDAIRQLNVINDPAYQFTLTGQAFASIGEWSLAEIALERAVRKDPAYAEAWAYLGETRQHTGSEEALSALQTAHTLKPDSFAANLFLSMYYRREGLALEAVKYLETAIEQDPDNVDLQADLAQTLVEAGGVGKGFAILEELVEESPDDVEGWLRLAQLSIDNNIQVTETGLTAARQALLLAPDHQQANLLLGRGYLFLGEKVLAERFLVKALTLDGQNPEAHFYLGILYLNLGETGKAQTQFHAAGDLAQKTGDLPLIEQIEKLLSEYFGE